MRPKQTITSRDSNQLADKGILAAVGGGDRDRWSQRQRQEQYFRCRTLGAGRTEAALRGTKMEDAISTAQKSEGRSPYRVDAHV